MFSPSVSLISRNYLPMHNNNIIAMAEAATPAPPPPQAAAAAVVFLFLFSTKGPFQGHILPLQGNIVYYFLPILLILDVFHQFQLPCYFFLSFSLPFLHFYSTRKFFYFKFINFSNPHFYRIVITFSYVQ